MSLQRPLNISRQAVIKTYLRQSLDQHYLARNAVNYEAVLIHHNDDRNANSAIGSRSLVFAHIWTNLISDNFDV